MSLAEANTQAGGHYYHHTAGLGIYNHHLFCGAINLAMYVKLVSFKTYCPIPFKLAKHLWRTS